MSPPQAEAHLFTKIARPLFNHTIASSAQLLMNCLGTIKVSMPSEFLVSFGAPLLKRIRAEAPDIQLLLAAEDKVLDHTKYARDLYVRVAKTHQQPAGLSPLHVSTDSVVLIGTEATGGKSRHR